MLLNPVANMGASMLLVWYIRVRSSGSKYGSHLDWMLCGIQYSRISWASSAGCGP